MNNKEHKRQDYKWTSLHKNISIYHPTTLHNITDEILGLAII